MSRQPDSGRRSAPFGLARWVAQHRGNQRGITLLETLIAMVVTVTVLLPTLGFVTMSMAEQASARTLTQETSNLAAADLTMVRDVSNALAVASTTAENGDPRAPTDLVDCNGTLGDNRGGGGQVVLAMVNTNHQRIVYSLEPAAVDAPQLGRNLWRRVCPNKSNDTDPTLGDTLLNSTPPPAAMGPTEGYKLAQRVGKASSSCPDGAGGQNLECRQVTLSLESVDKSQSGVVRPPVVIEATRRNSSYAAPTAAPIARFSWDPNRVEDLDTVIFDASGSRDRRGGTLEYSWKFESIPASVFAPITGDSTATAVEVPAPAGNGDPNFAASRKTITKKIKERPADANPALPVPPFGPLKVTLTVRNSAGKTASLTQDVDLQPKQPFAALAPGSGIVTGEKPLLATANKPATFVPDLKVFSGTTIASTEWDWGDGEKEIVCAAGGKTCVEPGVHKYLNPGLVFVKVTVTDTNGRNAYAQVAVKVEPDTLFVATTGTDSSNCGPIATPCRQIDYALGQAQSQGKLKVHVAQGSPYQRFSARSRIDVVGGWKDNFTDPNGTRSVVIGTADGARPFGIYLNGVHFTKVEGFEVRTPDAASGTTQGILVDAGSGDNATERVELKKITVTGGKGNQPSGVLIEGGSWVRMHDVAVLNSPEAVGTASSTYAVRVLNSNLYSLSGTYVASDGRDGANGSSGVPATGNTGCTGESGKAGGAFFGTGGNGAPGCGDGAGGGGNGGKAGNGGGRGGEGSGTTNGGGQGGSYGFFDSIAGYGGAGSGFAGPGGNGGGGGNKNKAATAGAVWVGNDGAAGARGTDGRGGAGGGGGGGNNCCAAGGGGAGGGGGKGGTPGTSVGRHGGGSFGIYAYQSVVNVDGGGILVGKGGKGGSGQPGGQGGKGGNGTNGGPDSSAEGGGGGGAGSGAGGGGGAGGGSGGPSVMVYLNSSTGAALNGVGGTPPAVGGAGGAGGARGARGDRGAFGIGDDNHNGGNAAYGEVGGLGGDGATGLAGARVSQ